MERLLIVDGHAYAYRAFYAIRALHSASGGPVNAIFGFVKMLAKMRAAIGPTHLIVVWDGGLSAERMALLPDYKAQRPEMPDELRPQLDGLVCYLKAAGVASYCGNGVEADDYIACLARRAADAGMGVIIASADKDFMQLVTRREARGANVARGQNPESQAQSLQLERGWVGLLNPGDKKVTSDKLSVTSDGKRQNSSLITHHSSLLDEVWSDEQVRAKSGVEPSQIVDWLALMGDSVDNIPGVPGVGPKTAAELLKQFGSVEKMFARLDEVKSERLRAALRSAEAAVRRNRELVRLRDDLPCDFSPDDLVVKPADTGRLGELYRQWGFKGMLAALEESARPAEPEQAILI